MGSQGHSSDEDHSASYTDYAASHDPLVFDEWLLDLDAGQYQLSFDLGYPVQDADTSWYAGDSSIDARIGDAPRGRSEVYHSYVRGNEEYFDGGPHQADGPSLSNKSWTLRLEHESAWHLHGPWYPDPTLSHDVTHSHFHGSMPGSIDSSWYIPSIAQETTPAERRTMSVLSQMPDTSSHASDRAAEMFLQSHAQPSPLQGRQRLGDGEPLPVKPANVFTNANTILPRGRGGTVSYTHL